MEKFRWLLAIVASCPDRKLVGRTRLQKTVKLLKRLGAPVDYDFAIHYYGPYSEGVQADTGLLVSVGLIEEEVRSTQDGSQYYVLRAKRPLSAQESAQLQPYRSALGKMVSADTVVLELAATYDAYREMGSNHQQALDSLRSKKGSKCTKRNIDAGLRLLKEIGLKVP